MFILMKIVVVRIIWNSCSEQRTSVGLIMVCIWTHKKFELQNLHKGEYQTVKFNNFNLNIALSYSICIFDSGLYYIGTYKADRYEKGICYKTADEELWKK